MNDEIEIRNTTDEMIVQNAMKLEDLIQQVSFIQSVMKTVMKDGEHYGKIPGCGDKPALLKPGAEKLSMVFRLSPQFDSEIIDLENGHREYRVVCKLYSIKSGNLLGMGVGSATTLESKWRFRTGPKELTSNPVPKKYWNLRKTDPAEAQKLIGGKGHSVAKGDDGEWYIAIQGERVEHDNPADYFNTAYKMAKKRAHVDAVLTVTAASDIFTQDIEEMAEDGTVGKQTKRQEQAPIPMPTEQPLKETENPTPIRVKEPDEMKGLFDSALRNCAGKSEIHELVKKAQPYAEQLGSLWFSGFMNACNEKIDQLIANREKR